MVLSYVNYRTNSLKKLNAYWMHLSNFGFLFGTIRRGSTIVKAEVQILLYSLSRSNNEVH